jgi:acyl carrier protein
MAELRAASTPGRSSIPTIDEVKATLRRLIQENAGIPAELIRDESTIDDDLAMDSFSFISLQVAVEDTFDITCEPADIEARRSFDGIAALVRERVAAAVAKPAPAPPSVRHKAPRRPRPAGEKSMRQKAKRPKR